MQSRAARGAGREPVAGAVRTARWRSCVARDARRTPLRFDAAIAGQPGLRVRVVAEASPLSTVMQPEELGQEADLPVRRARQRGGRLAPGVTLETVPRRSWIEAGVSLAPHVRARDGRREGRGASAYRAKCWPRRGTTGAPGSCSPPARGEAERSRATCAASSSWPSTPRSAWRVAISALRLALPGRPLRRRWRAAADWRASAQAPPGQAPRSARLRDALSDAGAADQGPAGDRRAACRRALPGGELPGRGGHGQRLPRLGLEAAAPVALKTIRLYRGGALPRARRVPAAPRGRVMAARFSHSTSSPSTTSEERRGGVHRARVRGRRPASSATCEPLADTAQVIPTEPRGSRAAWPRRTPHGVVHAT